MIVRQIIAKNEKESGQSRLQRPSRAWWESLELAIDRIGNPTIGLQIVELIWLHTSAFTESVAEDERFVFRFLTADELRSYSSDPALKLDWNLAERLESGQDYCFAAIDGEKLAAYGWYALDCIEAEHNFGIPMS